MTGYMTAFLFDLDGTLVNSSADLAASGNAVRQAFGSPPLPLEQVQSMIGDGLAALLERLLADAPLAPGQNLDMQRAFEVFALDYDQQCTRSTSLYAGLRPCLDTLRAAGHGMAVVSNKPDRWCQAIIAHLDLAAHFPVIIGGDGPRKPAPGQLIRAAQLLGVAVSDCVMVGDMANDVLAGRAAGCPVISVGWGFSALPEGVIADAHCQRPEDFPAVLREWGARI
ncbi:MAG: HAD family hydrolase [Planctomycetota bacterium]|nr:MAG: HAD family hydrolase [Planctomycetota bacterium]